MDKYIVIVSHDNGLFAAQTSATNIVSAIHSVITAEGCPISAVVEARKI